MLRLQPREHMNINLRIIKCEQKPWVDDDGNLHSYEGLLDVLALFTTPDGDQLMIGTMLKPHKLQSVLEHTMRQTVKKGIELGMIPPEAAG
jgi:hypothetical protein